MGSMVCKGNKSENYGDAVILNKAASMRFYFL